MFQHDVTEISQPRCNRCSNHPGWAHDDQSRRNEPEDVCRACFGSGVQQSKEA